MNSMFKTTLNTCLLILLLLGNCWVLAANIHQSILPVDVSFLVVDMKYSKNKEVKICEIQNGYQSSFQGGRFSNGGTSLIAQNFMNELDKYYDKSWVKVRGMSDKELKNEFLNNKRWSTLGTNDDLIRDPIFLSNASKAVNDRNDLQSYHGFVFLKPNKSDHGEEFRKKYPGVVVIDSAVNPYSWDKQKMSSLLRGNPLTEKHKPKWGFYQTKYEPDLAEKINRDIGSSMLVIKPINAFKGNGVIIVKKEDLNRVLKYILDNEIEDLTDIDDAAYDFWNSYTSDTFIVEEFIDSEPIAVPHLENKLYCPTLRLAFLLTYNKQKIEIICLGGYYKFPEKALSEEGSLNEKYKTCCEPPFYSKPDPILMKDAERQLKEVLHIVYQKMLGLIKSA